MTSSDSCRWNWQEYLVQRKHSFCYCSLTQPDINCWSDCDIVLLVWKNVTQWSMQHPLILRQHCTFKWPTVITWCHRPRLSPVVPTCATRVWCHCPCDSFSTPDVELSSLPVLRTDGVQGQEIYCVSTHTNTTECCSALVLIFWAINSHSPLVSLEQFCDGQVGWKTTRTRWRTLSVWNRFLLCFFFIVSTKNLL